MLRPLVLSNGAVEILKWIAAALMVGDHVNKYLLHGSAPALFDAGRLAMPLFAIVLGYNLARPGQSYGRVAARMAIAGTLASVPFVALGGLGWGWWPLNIMATFLVATVICWLLASDGALRIAAAAGLFVVGGSSVEFWWPGIALCVASWSYARTPSWRALAASALAVFSLRVINGNDWALATFVAILPAMHVPDSLRVPRPRLFFYAFYPVHLAVLLICQRALHLQ
jgi:TraX protein